jgi:hypothetical protein
MIKQEAMESYSSSALMYLPAISITDICGESQLD